MILLSNLLRVLVWL